MKSKNGIKKMSTQQVERPTNAREDPDKGFKTKGLVIAHAHPTPRTPDVVWACVGHPDPEMFQPTSTEALSGAVAVCGPCPARALCLELGLARKEWGVWGGVLLEAGKRAERVRPPGHEKAAPAAAVAGAA